MSGADILTVIYAVPAADEYDVLIAFVSTPSTLSTRMTVKPSSVLQPTVKLDCNVNGAWIRSERDILVGEHAIRNPLLCTIDNPELPVLGLLSGGLQSLNIASSEGLGDSQ